MKVLHILKTAIGANWAYEQARALHALGVEIVVALPPGNRSKFPLLAPRYRAAGIEVVEIDLNLPTACPWQMPAVFKNCRQLVRDVRPNLIHTHHVGTTFVVRLALGRRSCVPRIFGVTGTLHLEQQSMARADTHLAGPQDFWLATCRWTQSRYEELGISPERIFLAYLGTDIHSYRTERTGTLRAKLGLGPEMPLVGMVSLIYPPKRFLGAARGHKGHEDFISAFARLCENRPEVRGVMIGGLWGMGNWYEDRIRYLAEKLCGGNLTFLDTRNDIPELYPDLDLAVIPSYSDGLAYSVVEPLLAGVPVVATNVGGIPDIVRDGKTGWLVAPGNPNGLSAAMREALDHSGEARSRALAGQKLARQLLDLEDTGRAVLEVYESILGRSVKRIAGRFEARAPNEPLDLVAGSTLMETTDA
jgi:glycosyltransferase involved in cell wall biosynthesis